MKLRVRSTFRSAVRNRWGKTEEISKLSITELKGQVARAGSYGSSAAATMEDQIDCAVKIGVAIGKSKTPAEFLRQFESIELRTYTL